jgi:2-C-methyl-D-erythritol 2,4-cyclodiphosphate synthase
VKINVIIAAAGGSLRAKTAENKIFVKSAEGKPAILYSVGIFCGVPDVKKIIVAAKPSETNKIAEILKDLSKKGEVAILEEGATHSESVKNSEISKDISPKIEAAIYGGKETRSESVKNSEIAKIAAQKEEFSIEICGGGATRSESIKNALNRVDKDCEIVLIHDAARPYVSRELIDRVIADTEKFGSSVPFLPVADTLKYFNSDLNPHYFDIKKGNGLSVQAADNPKFLNSDLNPRDIRQENGSFVQAADNLKFLYIEKNAAPNTVDRKNYFTVSTPQGFFAEEIVRAYSKIDAKNDGFTDDSSVYEKYIAPVRLTEGQPSNIKITTERDVGEFKNSSPQKNNSASNALTTLRIGNGYDIHRLTGGRPLILGGVEIPHPLGLDGHSDADALVHSVIDALLSAVGSRDIGTLFPDDDPTYKGIDSMILLEKTHKILQEKSASILNISSVIIAEAPKLSPFVESMKTSIASSLKISPSKISISCKTNERLGEIGEKKAVAVHSVCLIAIDEF